MKTKPDEGTTPAAAGVLHPWQGAASLPEYAPFNCSVVGWCATKGSPVRASLYLEGLVLGSTTVFKPCLHPLAVDAAKALGATALEFTIVPHREIDRDGNYDLRIAVSLDCNEELSLYVSFAQEIRQNYKRELEKSRARERISLQKLVVHLLKDYDLFILRYCSDFSKHLETQYFIENASPFVERRVATLGDSQPEETTMTIIADGVSAIEIKIALAKNSSPDEGFELELIIEAIRRVRTSQPLIYKASECTPEFHNKSYAFLNCGGPLLDPNRIKRILVIKLDRIGDVVSSAAALQRLRQAFPYARLCLAVTSYTVDIARRLELADDIAGLEQFLGKTWDIAIDLRIDQDTRVFLESAKARFKASFGPPLEDPTHLRIPSIMPVPGNIGRNHTRHISDQLVSLVDALATSFRSHSLTAKSTRKINRRMVINIGPSNDTRCWPVERFALLTTLLAKEYNMTVAVLGSEDERSRAIRLIETLQQNDVILQDCVGNLGPSEIVDVIGSAMLFVGFDSGPKHIAQALGVPGLVLHGGRHAPAVWGGNAPTIFDIFSPVDCSPCLITKKQDCPNNSICLRNIDVETALSFARLAIALFCPLPPVEPGHQAIIHQK